MEYQVGYDEASLVKVEPWGSGTRGSEWSYKFENPIKEILISEGMYVLDSIRFRTLADKRDIVSPLFGMQISTRTLRQVYIANGPTEYLTGISGTMGHDRRGELGVKSLCFTTNLRTYGPIGNESGETPFSLVMKEGEAIVGFHGRAGKSLYAIGVYFQQLTPLPTLAKELKAVKIEPIESVDEKIEVDETIQLRCPGPWGGCGGKVWDDGVFSNVKQVRVCLDSFNSVICGLQVTYEKKNRTPFRSQLHGGPGHHVVSLNTLSFEINGHENEFLIAVEGFYSPIEAAGGLDVIRQITFYTNKRKYGPYGSEIGTYFSSSAARGKIVGFHGRNGVYLYAIGVHMEYF